MNNNDKFTKGHEVKKLLFFVGFLLITILIFWQLSESGWIDFLGNQEEIHAFIEQIGLFGPVLIILLIATAIIISPIPSAPIALISGALYGHTLGTIYVVLGALSGALSAFIIARKLGHDYVSKKLQLHLPEKMLDSQSTLMFIVFVSRLTPFISFDVISYAAGLTNLSLGRFFIATLIGIMPISFILAHVGSEVTNNEFESITVALIFLGFMTMIPMVINKIIKPRN